MGKRISKRRLSPLVRNVIIGLSVILLFLCLILVEVIVPNHLAQSYIKGLDTSSKKVQLCFISINDTTSLDVYYSADAPVKDKQQNVRTIHQRIQECRNQLDMFNNQTASLPGIHLSGYTRQYHEASVRQKHAYDLIGQSRDVLNQYQQLADFLQAYLDAVAPFADYVGQFNSVSDVSIYADKTDQLQAWGKTLHAKVEALQRLPTPAGYEQLTPATAEMLSNAAYGFEYFASGLRSYNIDTQNYGISLVEKGATQNRDTVEPMLPKALKRSYVVQQVHELTGKIDNLFSGSVE